MAVEIKQFQYEVQPYQENCIDNIVAIFQKLAEKQPFADVFKSHYGSNGYPFLIKEDSKNIDVMMETGTGKTFTFLKTIFELNKSLGYKKFIILVPTVPIREGTKINLEDTKDYFKALYANAKEKVIESFVYESGNIAAVKGFINAAQLSVLVMTPSSFDKKENILNQHLDREIHAPELFIANESQPKTYLDCLKCLNPIVIMDEPHRFDGDAFKKHFAGFDNYYLRFGATFPNKKDSLVLSNVAYSLDSISSFRQNLVKKIVVYTQDVVAKVDTLTAIENEKAIISRFHNGFLSIQKLNKGEIFNGVNIKKINKDSLVLADGTIEKVDYSLSDDALKAMINQTVKIHLEKEKDLFEQGIKALCLFFIPSDIGLFRGENPKIKNIFEEEYTRQRAELIKKLPIDSGYLTYLQKDFDTAGLLQVHKGYFSGDKGKNADDKIKAGVDEILRDKKKLLSFESPTRFIFSIWALQEGWDNPNVFTICKLSNQGSENSKLQQIGRGLRICVNQNLQRKTMKALNDDQEQFWQLNNLDVVVSNKEQGFVEEIQNEILKNSLVVATTFTEQELKKLLKEKGNFDDATVRKLFKTLDAGELIVFKQTIDGVDIFEKSPNFTPLLKDQKLPPEQEKVLADLFATDVNAYIQKAETKKTKKKVFIKASYAKAFRELWATIHKNAFYVLDTLDEVGENQLVQNIKTEIEKLNTAGIFLNTVRAELHVNKIDKEDAISKQTTASVSYIQKMDYLELVRDISHHTKTPITFVVKIFNALDSNFKKNISANPKQVQAEIIKIIRNQLVSTINAKVSYQGIDATVLPNVFHKDAETNQFYLTAGSTGRFQKDISGDFSLKTKWLFEEVIEYDSDFELEIVEKDPDIQNIQFFGKLPKLEIQTPLGKYNPDFCYVVQNNEGSKLFLVVESKGYATATDIPQNELAKINFAKKYFEALNAYYQSQNSNVKISFQERINSTTLAALIHNT